MEHVSAKYKEALLLASLLVLLIPLEAICARLAFQTIGEIVSTLYFLAIGLNLLFLVLAIRYRTVAALGVILLALAIIPYQLYLGNRLVRVQAEVSRIVTFAYEERVHTSRFPVSLARYEYEDPEMERYIKRYQVVDDGDGFSLFYRVGTENTSHFYTSRSGWGYYPD
jgi:uncharacterized protein (DUF58 family)